MTDAVGLYDYIAGKVFDAHTPNLTEEDEGKINDIVMLDTYEDFISDLAKRTCSCGFPIDGYYDYIGHIKQVVLEAQP